MNIPLYDKKRHRLTTLQNKIEHLQKKNKRKKNVPVGKMVFDTNPMNNKSTICYTCYTASQSFFFSFFIFFVFFLQLSLAHSYNIP